MVLLGAGCILEILLVVVVVVMVGTESMGEVVRCCGIDSSWWNSKERELKGLQRNLYYSRSMYNFPRKKTKLLCSSRTIQLII
jgi:hypothetical protein